MFIYGLFLPLPMSIGFTLVNLFEQVSDYLSRIYFYLTALDSVEYPVSPWLRYQRESLRGNYSPSHYTPFFFFYITRVVVSWMIELYLMLPLLVNIYTVLHWSCTSICYTGTSLQYVKLAPHDTHPNTEW